MPTKKFIEIEKRDVEIWVEKLRDSTMRLEVQLQFMREKKIDRLKVAAVEQSERAVTYIIKACDHLEKAVREIKYQR